MDNYILFAYDDHVLRSKFKYACKVLLNNFVVGT